MNFTHPPVTEKHYHYLGSYSPVARLRSCQWRLLQTTDTFTSVHVVCTMLKLQITFTCLYHISGVERRVAEFGFAFRTTRSTEDVLSTALHSVCTGGKAAKHNVQDCVLTFVWSHWIFRRRSWDDIHLWRQKIHIFNGKYKHLQPALLWPKAKANKKHIRGL